MAEGTNGAEATKAKVSGVISRHAPATGGVSEGVGDVGLSGPENWTERVASVGTDVAPEVGVTVVTANGPSWADASTACTAVEVGEAAARCDESCRA